MLFPVVLIVLVGGAVSQITTGAPHTHKPAPDLESALGRRAHFSMILDLLRTTGLLTQLKALPQVTLFAPTNAALSSIPNDEYQDLKADVPRLTSLLKYHVTTDQAFHTTGRANDVVFNSLDNNLPIRINIYKIVHTIAAEGVNITDKDIRVANGFVQGIDNVMQPPNGDVVDIINNMDNTKMLAGLINSAGLESAIRADLNITVFAPTNDAFAKLDPQVLTYLQNNPKALTEVLLYHVVKKTTLYSIGMRHAMTFQTADKHHDNLMLIEGNNDDIYLNHAKVDDRDISATNGVIHTIEDVLVPTTVLVAIEDQGLLVG
ncbi:transforming growth factor-beta-induced protein ig-h3-like [Aplysia californica]|uniref:Transforming growth factor-beta-induced protein ig-h3-like n=1 Tax=Aplysia californica TaxID=6500 RepID=A0ABM1A5V4_APLCA|nr:transforming growth factor-beta-induced protein ig-h3-like [Aplysia californica]